MKTSVGVVGSFMFVAVLFLCSACGFAVTGKTIVPSKTYVTREVSATHVTSIVAYASVNVVYYQTAGSPRIEIYAPENILPYIDVAVSDGELKAGIKLKNGESVRWGDSKCEVRVYAPEVISFAASSSADIKLGTALNTAKPVRIHSSSSGDVDASVIKCGELDMEASSSGDIKLSDVVCNGKVTLDISSSGDINIDKLDGGAFFLSASSSGDCNIGSLVSSADMEMEASSSGGCEVKSVICAGNISAAASSSGDIVLKNGSCRDAVFSATSSGNVVADNVKAGNVTASASTSGDITCHPSGTLTVKVSTGGSVGYKGSPAHISGDVKKVSKL